MLDTRFPRPPGDIGNPASFSGPVLFETVPRASAEKATAPGGPDDGLIAPFAAALRRLQARGANIVGTSCGFLAPLQRPLSQAVSIPFVASSLIALPALERVYGGRGSVGVLTYSAGSIGTAHFRDISPSLPPIGGLAPDGHLATMIREDRTNIDMVMAERDTVDAARRLQSGPGAGIAAVLMECTNLGPYRAAVAEATGLPVFDSVWVLENRLRFGPRFDVATPATDDKV